jgi:formate-dependent nitrite reductase membrane component NrfD
MSTADALRSRAHMPTRGGATAPGQATSRAAHSKWVERAGRIGHVAKGVSYALIAILALQVAFGQRGQTSDREGVLREVASQPFGTVALWMMAAGFLGYAIWEFARAILDRRNEGSDAKGLAKRAKCAVVGAIYVASAAAAVALAMGSSSGSGGNEKAETAKVLDWPAGQWIVGIVGVALAVYGIANVWKAKTQKFTKDLDDHKMNETTRTWAVRSGIAGHAARGVVFTIVGVFLTKAAYEYDPDEAVGIDGALAKLAHQSYGTWLLGAVAIGLLAYAVFCLVQARYRRV